MNNAITGDSESLYKIISKEYTETVFLDWRGNDKLRALSNFDNLEDLFKTNQSVRPVRFLPKNLLKSKDENKLVMNTISEIIKTGDYTSGNYVTKFENEFEKFYQKHFIACSSGTMATILALRALGVKPGDEVILPANSFAATENAVMACNAKPIFVDIEENSYCISSSNIEKAITKKTKAIIAVHLYGEKAKTKDIYDICIKNKIYLIEDACQALNLREIGQYSHAAVVSFNPYKNFGLCGKAGGIILNNKSLYEKLISLSYHGFSKDKKNYKKSDYGFNAKIDNIQAACGYALLPFFSYNLLKRSFLAYRYINLLRDLQIKEKINLPVFTKDHSWHLFPIMLNEDISNVDFFKSKLATKGIEVEHYYPVLSHKQKTSFVRSNCKNLTLKNTELIHDKTVHLPLFNNMSLEEQEYVINEIYNLFK